MLLLFQSKDGSQTVSHPNIFFRTETTPHYALNALSVILEMHAVPVVLS